MVDDRDSVIELVLAVVAVTGGLLCVGTDAVTDDFIRDAAVCDELTAQTDMLDHSVVMILAEHGDHFLGAAGLDSALTLIASAGNLLNAFEGYVAVERRDPFMGLLHDFQFSISSFLGL